jgi:hypothetical protein
MLTFINGDSNTFSAIACGAPDPMTAQWCLQRNEAIQSQMLPEARTFFQNTVGTVFDALAYNDITRMAKALVRKVESFWMPDHVQVLDTIGKLQNAPNTMLQYIMACPGVRDMYYRQEIAGYDGRWVDQEHRDIDPTETLAYKAVVNGVFQQVGDTEEEICVEYLGEFDTPETEIMNLDLADQTAIMETWAHMKMHLSRRKEDPTSPANAML